MYPGAPNLKKTDGNSVNKRDNDYHPVSNETRFMHSNSQLLKNKSTKHTSHLYVYPLPILYFAPLISAVPQTD